MSQSAARSVGARAHNALVVCNETRSCVQVCGAMVTQSATILERHLLLGEPPPMHADYHKLVLGKRKALTKEVIVFLMKCQTRAKICYHRNKFLNNYRFGEIWIRTRNVFDNAEINKLCCCM